MIKLKTGKKVQIHGYKHDGSLHRVWTNSIVIEDCKDYLVTGNLKTKVIESDGRSWYTKEPALCYFFEREWFNIIAMFKKDGIHYYCNISSPYTYDGEAIKYIDYDLDLKVFPNGRMIVLDQKEFEQTSQLMSYSDEIKKIALNGVLELKRWIKDKHHPFDNVCLNKHFDSFKKMLGELESVEYTKNKK